jgi:hypothetical protein
MNSWAFFKDCEREIERDRNEGVLTWLNPSRSALIINGRHLTREGGTLSASVGFNDPSLKIFCASAFYRHEQREPGRIIDESVLRHGSHVLVVHNTGGFCERLFAKVQSLRAAGIVTQSGAERIEYFDEDEYDGDVGPFRKAARYSKEKEWRLGVRTAATDDGPFQFEIGSIESLSILKETKAFENRIERRADDLINVCL